MGCCAILIKIFLFCVNFIIAVLGLVIVSAGGVLAYFRNQIGTELPVLLAILLIVAGSVIFFIAFCGCCGAIGDMPCFLIMYAIFITLLAAANIYFIVLVFQSKNIAETTFTENLNEFFEDPEIRETFYFIEYILSCCGTTGADAYESIGAAIPPTCCPNYNFPNLDDIGNIQDIINNLNGTTEICAKEETYDGCSPIIIDLLMATLNVFAYIFIGILVAQALAILSSIYLVRRIRRYRGGKVYSNNNAGVRMQSYRY